MSPMLDIQRRWSEAFRIRLGTRRADGTPQALHGQIRITSPSEDVIQAVARVYGGVSTEWNGQRQIMIDVDALRIVVLPGDACVGWWEQWKQKGGMPVCSHRCDGVTNHVEGTACTCPELEARLANPMRYCRPTTRLWVMLPDVEVIGAGRLESHGRIAAETLPQSVAVLKAALDSGELIPATLRIVRVQSSGKDYLVPRIEIVGLSLDQILTGGRVLAPTLPAAPVSVSPGDRVVGSAARDSLPGGSTPLNDLLEHARNEWGMSRPREILDRVGELVGRSIASLNDVTLEDVAAATGVPSTETETDRG